jgi:hypothetical protein
MNDAMRLYNDAMKRTTIMADERLLDRLRDIADRRGISMAEAVRRALETWAEEQDAPPRCQGAVASEGEPFDTARRSGEMQFYPRSWRS